MSSKNFKKQKKNIYLKQECIPVGCIPPAAVAISRGGVCLSACWDTPIPTPWVWAWRPPCPHSRVWAWRPPPRQVYQWTTLLKLFFDRSNMESISADCQELKRDYDTCFNFWFKNSFLKGKSEDTCAPLFKVYQTCVKVSKATKTIFKSLRN